MSGVESLLLTAIAGFGTGLSLIVAIGAQNAFVLRQGIQREAVPVVVTICALSDVVLIALGISGVGAAVTAWPQALTVAGIVGGVFLLTYGLLAARRAFRPSSLDTRGAGVGSRRRAVLTCLAMTWLNPHVYLDTLLLIGAIAAGHGSLRWIFGLGAAIASACWFTSLGFGARLLSGFFARPAAWRVLDILVAATMFTVGVTLLTHLS